MSPFTLDQFTRMLSLRQLHLDGWRFHRKHSPDPPHELDELVYSFLHGEWLDILRIRSDVEANAGRFLTESVIAARPRACWTCAGTLAEVLDELRELPTPSSRLAPRLLLSSAQPWSETRRRI
ncbi:MAG: hypothetical protein ABIQ18_05020 [Umezawaea sp.]